MDEATFDSFYTTSFPRLVGHLHAMCGNLSEAQDCVQEAFVRAWDARHKLDRERSPEAWVRTTAYRLAVSGWRRRTLGRRAPDRSMQPRGPIEPDPTRVAVTRALQLLPPDQRRAIVLYHLCDLSVSEVADEMGVPSGTVKARLSRGRATLSLLLDDEERSGEGARHA